MTDNEINFPVNQRMETLFTHFCVTHVFSYLLRDGTISGIFDFRKFFKNEILSKGDNINECDAAVESDR